MVHPSSSSSQHTSLSLSPYPSLIQAKGHPFVNPISSSYPEKTPKELIDEVDAAFIERVASEKASDCEIGSFENTVSKIGFNCVFGAAGIKSAARAYEGAHRVLINAN